MTGKCPFGKTKCEECALYRKGLRYFDTPGSDGLTRQPVPFEECAITIGIDCLENLVGRSIANQKAIEQTRNEIRELRSLFEGLARRQLQ